MSSGLTSKLTLFRGNEDGVTSIEYAVIIAIISGVLLVALPTLGEAITNPMTSLASALTGDGGGDGGDGGGDGGDGGDDGGDGGDDDGGDHHDGDHGGDGEHD